MKFEICSEKLWEQCEKRWQLAESDTFEIMTYSMLISWEKTLLIAFLLHLCPLRTFDFTSYKSIEISRRSVDVLFLFHEMYVSWNKPASLFSNHFNSWKPESTVATTRKAPKHWGTKTIKLNEVPAVIQWEYNSVLPYIYVHKEWSLIDYSKTQSIKAKPTQRINFKR